MSLTEAKQTAVPHTCAHCQAKVLKLHEQDHYRPSLQVAQWSYQEITSAVRDNCAFFKWALCCIMSASPTLDEHKVLRLVTSLGSTAEFYWEDLTRPPSHGTAVTGDRSLCGSLTQWGNPKDLSPQTQDLLPIHRFVDVDAMYTVARSFMEDHCWTAQNGPSYMPSRVIDIGRGQTVRCPSLYWPDENEQGRWAVLSYCWGGDQPWKLTRSRLQDYTDGIPLLKLPQTIRDALTVAHRLGLQFVWVDSLCIVQDDFVEMHEEIGKMSRYYGQAFVTISATSASHSREGFLTSQSASHETLFSLPYQYQPRYSDDLYRSPGSLLLTPSARPLPHKEPLHSRAWALQELVLSRCVLQFETRQLRFLWRSRDRDQAWTCGASSPIDYGEVGSRDEADSVLASLGLVQKNSSIETWRSLVQAYTRRHLTVPNDRIIAIYAIAEHFQRFLDSRYLAGLWASYLPQELLWTCADPKCRPKRYRAPSWSWFAVDGPINHLLCTIFESWYAGVGHVTTVESQTQLVSADRPYGMVQSGFIRIKGHLRQALWTFRGELLKNDGSAFFTTAEIMPDAIEDDMIAGRSPVRNVWCLNFSPKSHPCMGLILVAETSGGEKFKRIGAFRCRQASDGDSEAQEAWEYREIVLI